MSAGSSTTTNNITVSNVKPVANFVATPVSGNSPLAVQFNDTSTGSNITVWQWNFGDGTANVTTQNATHTYINNLATNARYTVMLTVYNDGGGKLRRKK